MNDYYSQLGRAIDYMEEHLTEEISAAAIAEQAFFSITHFYRIFRGMTGESVKDYMRKRRLSQSAVDLLTDDKRILEIALAYGFESQETYSRAFAKQFGLAPGRYRKNRNHIVLYERLNVGQPLPQGPISPAVTPVQVKTVYKKAFQVRGLQTSVKPGSDSINELWHSFNTRRVEIDGLPVTEPCLGICEYYPDITDDDDFTYLAGVEVDPSRLVPSGMVSRTIPGAKYAVFVRDDTGYPLKDIYAYIYGVWLPQSGCEPAERDTLECYGLTPGGLEIYIPIK
jgi:AraC family transcriptional regulator